MNQTPHTSAPSRVPSPDTQRTGRRIPSLGLGVAVALHFWFGAMGVGWWFTEWLIARADDSVSTDHMPLILVVGGLLWVVALAGLLRIHPISRRLTWLPIIAWVVIFAALFLLR